MTVLQNKTLTIGAPAIAAVVLALIGGVAQVVNYSIVSAGSQLHAAIAVALYFMIAAGIPPLTGPAFKAALHLPAWASLLIGALMGTALLALTSIRMGASVHEIIAAVLTALSALGFSASVAPLPVTAANARPRHRAPPGAAK